MHFLPILRDKQNQKNHEIPPILHPYGKQNLKTQNIQRNQGSLFPLI